MSVDPLVHITIENAVAHIALHRPDAGNAISLQLCRELHAAVATAADDASVRAVLLEGAGSTFCVGGDLVEFANLGDRRPEHLATLTTIFHATQRRLMTMAAPVVVAVQGPAAGAGLSLALSGDIVLASPAAHFTSAYTAIGLSADGGSTHLLPRLVGLRRTQELLITNRRLSAGEALEWGMITAVIPEPELHGQAVALAQRLASGPTEAYGVIKRLLASTYARSFVEQTDVEGLEIARLSGGADAAEGIAAFRARRPPSFRGRPIDRA